ncbi:MAG: amidase [Solirubrobacteraceae bacterium]
MTDRGLCRLPARTLAAALATRELSSVELLEAHLDQIADVNPQVNAIVTLDADAARVTAAALDRASSRGAPLGPLHGLPIAIKDLEDTAGLRTTYGSPLFADHVPEHDSLIVERLRRAGAVIVGKTNTPEFGAGSQTFNEVFGPTRNPYDVRLTCGGSSGGAAVAVACGMVPIADGSDLGGSLRNPAAFCNVVGLRPSSGLVPSTTAAGDPWESMSVLGPIARSVDDAGLLFGAMAGYEPLDPRSRPVDPGLLQPIRPAPVSELRIAWSRCLGDLPVAHEISAAIERSRGRLVALGVTVQAAEPDLTGADEVFDTLRALGFATGIGPLLAEHPEGLKDTVVGNAQRGLDLSGAQVGHALRGRGRIFTAMGEFMNEYDVLALPTTQVAPFSVSTEWPREIAGERLDNYTDWMRSCSRITVTGHPAISIPAGFTADGLPVGLQLVGRHFGERRLLSIAAALEAALSHPRLPPVVRRSPASRLGQA